MKKYSAIESALGMFVFHGDLVYAAQQIVMPLRFEKVVLRRCSFNFSIELCDSIPKMTLGEMLEDKSPTSTLNSFINVLLKQLMRNMGLQQMGRNPHFFNTESQRFVERANLQIWDGFKASSIQYDNGFHLMVEDICKFMPSDSCLGIIDGIYDSCKTDDEYQKKTRDFFTGATVLTQYGQKRPYRISDVDFDKTPETLTFDRNGKTVSVATYFKSVYGKTITRPNE